MEKNKQLYGKDQKPHDKSKKIMELAKIFEGNGKGEKEILEELDRTAKLATQTKKTKQ